MTSVYEACMPMSLSGRGGCTWFVNVCHLWGRFAFSLTGGFSEDSTRVSSFYNPSRPIATADTTSGDWGAGLNADGGRSAMAATGGVRGMYGLSPRVPLPTSNRTMTMSKKAKRTF